MLRVFRKHYESIIFWMTQSLSQDGLRLQTSSIRQRTKKQKTKLLYFLCSVRSKKWRIFFQGKSHMFCTHLELMHFNTGEILDLLLQRSKETQEMHTCLNVATCLDIWSYPSSSLASDWVYVVLIIIIQKGFFFPVKSCQSLWRSP